MERKYEYNINDIYGILKLIELFRHKNTNRLTAKVKCVYCGKIKTMNASDLYNGKHTSCICRTRSHGLSNSKIYSVYSNMKDRCFNNNNHAYNNYGGKGVTVCKQWVEDFKIFYEWSINNGYKEGLSIDRVDANGNYEPSNCRWITLSQNVSLANKTNVRRKADKGDYYGVSPEGDVYYFSNASEFCREHNLNANAVRRVARGERKAYKKWRFGYID